MPEIAVPLRRNDRDCDAEAEQLCLDVLTRRPFNHETHTCLGVLNFQRGQLSVAGYHLRHAVEIDPYRGSHVDLGSFLAKLGGVSTTPRHHCAKPST